MILVRFGWPADPADILATSATYEEVEALVREYRYLVEQHGWHPLNLDDYLKSKLPRASLDALTIRGYFGDSMEREAIR